MSAETHPPAGVARRSNRPEQAPPGYYDISILKAPLWSGEVGVYFFLGGLSAGSYLLARLAERFGQGQLKDVTRAGSLVSLAAMLPCAPLLIADLGDPKRFHHMLRVWKPTSPMNLGTWILSSYSPLCALAGLRELAHLAGWLPAPTRGLRLMEGAIRASDVAGMPLAVGMAGYTGVLLSTTATPVWCKNPWIGALFSASALHTGASAIALVLGLAPETPGGRAIAKLDRLATAAEVASLAGYFHHAGELSKPLVEGDQSRTFWVGAMAVGLVGPVLVHTLPIPKGAKKVAAAVLSLAGGLAVRWAFNGAGRSSALDPAAARMVSRGDR